MSIDDAAAVGDVVDNVHDLGGHRSGELDALGEQHDGQQIAEDVPKDYAGGVGLDWP